MTICDLTSHVLVVVILVFVVVLLVVLLDVLVVLFVLDGGNDGVTMARRWRDQHKFGKINETIIEKVVEAPPKIIYQQQKVFVKDEGMALELRKSMEINVQM